MVNIHKILGITKTKVRETWLGGAKDYRKGKYVVRSEQWGV